MSVELLDPPPQTKWPTPSNMTWSLCSMSSYGFVQCMTHLDSSELQMTLHHSPCCSYSGMRMRKQKLLVKQKRATCYIVKQACCLFHPYFTNLVPFCIKFFDTH